MPGSPSELPKSFLENSSVQCLHQLFEEQAKKTPDAVAVEYEDQELTYNELNHKANRLARYLRSSGVGPDVLVGIGMSRSLDLIVSLLAILKAGGAYVPLDPNYPDERLKYMLDDAKAKILLAEDALMDKFVHLSRARVICPSRDSAMISRESGDSPDFRVDPENICYLIYTSGSTGAPKGVMIRHQSIVNLLLAVGPEYGLTATDRYLQTASINFDASVEEIFLPLSVGACLILPGDGLLNSIPDFIKFCDDRSATVLDLPTAYWHELTSWLSNHDLKLPSSLRLATVGGEAMLGERLALWHRLHTGVRLINVYGPTEATVEAALSEMGGDRVSIGHPVANVQIHLLDSGMRPVSQGLPGEIFIGGAGLARGYLNRPDLTAERFVPDPFGGVPGARLYKTGDLARLGPEGDLEYLGRIDNQVKIRGFRIELGEIESALNLHPAVREALVLAREDNPGEKQLVSYVVKKEGSAHELSAEILRAYLKLKLPSYAVPAAYFFLEKFPLTPSGKIDRRALPAPARIAPEGRDYQPPRREKESKLAAIWTEALKLERVSRNDNFFELGGDSLLAIRVLGEMTRQGLHVKAATFFSAPTLSDLAISCGSSGIMEAPPNKIPIGCDRITPEMLPLVRLTNREIDRIVSQVPDGAANVQDIYPLTPLQEGILFHHFLTGEDPYVLFDLWGFDDRRRAEAFLEALRSVIDRHDILRTAMVWDGLPEPLQVVWRKVVLPVEEVELGAGDAEAQLYAHTAPRRRRIDLRRAPMLRAYLAYDREKNRWLIALVSHHLIGDHTTMQLMWQEIRERLLGRAGTLPPPHQFRNLVAQARLGSDRKAHEEFFRRMLGDIDEPTAPFGLLDVHGDGTSIGSAKLMLEAALARRLRDSARAQKVSSASLFHLAWAHVLARVSGREDVVFGTVLFGRMHGQEGVARGLGLFMNTLPMRIRLGEEGVGASLRQTHARLADLLEHEHASLALAQRCSRVPAETPLFSALLNYAYGSGADAGSSEGADHGYDGIKWLRNEESTNYPLQLDVHDLREGFELEASVRAPIPPRSVCEYMRVALESLVDALEAAPDKPTRELNVIPEEERFRLLQTWNDTRRDYPKGRCLHELFEERAESTPGAIAIELGDDKLTYQALDDQANRLARHLISLGVGPETFVGLCAERSLEMVVGILGILKAGAAYMPMDPGYPDERLAYMIKDSGAKLALVQEKHAARLSRLVSRIVSLDGDLDFRAARDAEVQRRACSSENLCYLIYTSGSTGTPKGVMTSHDSAVNFATSAIAEYKLTREDRVLQLFSISFDASVEEIFPCLIAGGTLVLRGDDYLDSPAKFLERCREKRLSVLDLPTAFWHQLAEDLPMKNQELPRSVRLVIIGGEAASAERLAAWQKSCGSKVRTVNTYGPTEATVVAILSDLTNRELDPSRPVPIGRPMGNTRVYLLDQRRDLVPIGVAGELYIGGAGVARGYLHRPDLTAERFIADPFGGEPGARIYKTGDLARYLPDGTIEYLGRADEQVKIRGYRIELGEIDSVIQQHPDVKEVVVVAREDRPGDRRLVAYVVGDVARGTLRDYLKEKLPDYMMPAAFVFLDKLPLTPSGKIDRRSLPAPDKSRGPEGYVAPRGEVERLLAEIWAEVLGVHRVGSQDNFFELGGHSLLATQVVSRARDAFKIDLPLRKIFERPTVAALGEEVEGLLGRSEGAAGPAPRARTAGSAELPLSFAQERLWFLDRLEPNSSFYNIPLALRLTGLLDREALTRSIQEIVRRHEVLRTTFASKDGRPVQVVRPPGSIEVAVVEPSGTTVAERELEALRISREEASRAFDLTRDPLLRANLVRLSAEDHLLMLTMHHIVSDGWSTSVFFRELEACYGAYQSGKKPLLEDLPIQYADFAIWQREWLKGKALERQMSYWKEQLNDLPILHLPTDRPRPPIQTYRGAYKSFALPRAIEEGVRELSRRHGVTNFMTLFAAFNVLLSRYSGQEDIPVGTPIANRNRSEIEGLIGCFVNTLVLRTDLSGDPTFLELLGRVREASLGAYAHQDLPFEKLVEELKPERNTSRSPLFQIMFAEQNAAAEGISLPGVSVSPVDVVWETSMFDMSVSMDEGSDGLACDVEYNTDLFDEATIARMIGHLQRLLSGIIENPESRLSDLPLLTESEERQLLDAWNVSSKEYPKDHRCAQRLFEEQVERSPDAVAVEDDDRRLTYRELNEKANQLSRHLTSIGVGPDVLVGICVERSLEMIVGMLGVLKAGGAYVPLDPAYPPERLAFMIEDSRPKTILTQRKVAGRLPAGAALIHLDDPIPGGVRKNGNPRDVARPGDLAYVIYTSGTTGRPKGVAMVQAGLSDLLCWYRARVPDGLAATQFSSISFDVSVMEIFTTLCSGGRLVLIPEEAKLDVPRLLDLVTAKKIERLDLPVSLLEQLAENAIDRNLIPASLRHVSTGSEQVRISPSIKAFFDRLKGCRFENQYGPTEAHVVASAYETSGSPETWPTLPPIGRPIANTTIYLLDRNLRPVPIGVGGELCIGGAGLARGYLSRPDLTADKFVPDPFSAEPGARLYRTGDLARYLPSGDIEYLGRIDNQVKIRGFRIELSEIESVLAQHPRVKEAVVLAREDAPGDKRLVAYMVTDVVPAVLREYLKSKLPEYMVPAAFVFLDKIPLTANGKIDRRSLPPPDRKRERDNSAAPRGEAERVLADIWAKALNLERVGVHDNFFDLGGDSILSLQIVARANQSGLELTANDMFQYQTIAELARAGERKREIHAEQDLVTGTVPLTPIQREFFEQDLPNPQHYNWAFMFELNHELDRSALKEVLGFLLRHHDGLRLRFVKRDDGWIQSCAGPEDPAISDFDLAALPREERQKALEATVAQVQTSLDLANGPLIRIALIKVGGQSPYRLLFVMHHMVIDRVSWRILREDFEALYDAALKGKSLSLPSKTTSFQRWAERLMEYAQGPVLLQEMDYWLSQEPTRLPVDKSDRPGTVSSTEIVTMSLSARETQTLLHEAPKAYHTQINDILLTALVRSMGRWTGADGVLIDLEGHGREHIFNDVDISRTVGWFTSIFPARLSLGKGMGPADSLRSIKEQLRKIPNHGIGYGLLRYLTREKRVAERMRGRSKAQLCFNYFGQDQQNPGAASLFDHDAKEFDGSAQDPNGARSYLLEVNALLDQGALNVCWDFSRDVYHAATIEALARDFLTELRALIAHCSSAGAPAYAPADFPLADIDQRSLDGLTRSAAIAERAIEDIYPLSPMQRELLSHAVSSRGSVAYFEQDSLRITGNLDIAAFKQAWQELHERHPILRTSFAWEGVREPLQVVHRRAIAPWDEMDWRGLPREDQKRKMDAFLLEDRRRGFDLSTAPLTRFFLIHISDETYQFVWSSHHIILDGWSTPLIYEEVLSAYRALCKGEDGAITAPTPYREYIAWLKRQDGRQAEDFWRQALKGSSASKVFARNWSSGAASRESDYAEEWVRLPSRTTEALGAMARWHRLTLNTVLQGAWAILLSRHSGEKDVLFGSIVAGRPAEIPDVESMVGLFINALPVRARISGNETLIDWLADLQKRQAESRRYGFSSLADLRKWSGVPQGEAIFDHVFAFQNYPMNEACQRDLNITIAHAESFDRFHYPLKLTCFPEDKELSILLEYNKSIIKAATVQDIARQFRALLESISEGSEKQVGEFRAFSSSRS